MSLVNGFSVAINLLAERVAVSIAVHTDREFWKLRRIARRYRYSDEETIFFIRLKELASKYGNSLIEDYCQEFFKAEAEYYENKNQELANDYHLLANDYDNKLGLEYIIVY